MTPRRRYDEKVALTLKWLGVMGWTTSPMIREALSVASNDFPPRMQRLGLLRPTEIPGLPVKLWSLSSAGRSLAAIHLGREVTSPPRMDKLRTSYLSHDLMTQRALLTSLKAIATRNGMRLDLAAFLNHARESRDLSSVSGWARPDILYVNPASKVGFALEVERSQKGSPELRKEKLYRLLRFAGSQGFSRLAIEFAILGGEKAVERYRACWDTVLEDARQEGLSTQELSRVSCRFRYTDHYPGIR